MHRNQSPREQVEELRERVVQACMERDHWKKRAKRAERRLKSMSHALDRQAESARALADYLGAKP